MATVLQKTRTVLEMIKFEHSVFALPFALTGALLAVRGAGLSGPALAQKLAWIIVAMVAARSAAMAFNRVVDADIDAKNPRTKTRAIPAGQVSRAFTWGFIVFFWSAAFVLAAAMLNPLCLLLSPVALIVVCGYSYTKRFTSLSHVALGVALGIAPLAAWIAVRGEFAAPILLLAAVTLWVAGFDMIYACQDFEFDRAAGLHSIPARLGVRRSLLLARVFHVAMIALLAWLWSLMELGWLGLAGVAVTAALLAWEHSLVSPDDLSKVNAAFFTANGVVSVLFFLFWAVDIVSRGDLLG